MARRCHLKRALSKLGFCSRSQAVSWIVRGKVSVNGLRVTDPLVWVDLDADDIGAGEGISRRLLPKGPEHVCLVLHKPRGHVTTRRDERGRATVYDLLPAGPAGDWVFPVGRLDRDSEGLLVLTNDGKLGHRLTDPSGHVVKTYRVLLDRALTCEEERQIGMGIPVDGVPTRPAGIARVESSWYEVKLAEGRNRQIRKMFRSLGLKVRRLIRTAIGDLPLGDLPAGEWRLLDDGDIGKLLGHNPGIDKERPARVKKSHA